MRSYDKMRILNAAEALKSAAQKYRALCKLNEVGRDRVDARMMEKEADDIMSTYEHFDFDAELDAY